MCWCFVIIKHITLNTGICLLAKTTKENGNKIPMQMLQSFKHEVVVAELRVE